MPHYFEILALIGEYGHLIVFLGAVFEGETIVILSGLFAHQGYLSLGLVIMLAYIGTVIGDCLWFLVGRYRFPGWLHQSEWFQRLSQRPVGIVNKDPEILALTMRFMYGFRTLIPLGLGLSNISTLRFFLLHSLGAIAWVLVYTGIGFFLGQFLETLFGRIKHGEALLIAVVIVLVVLAITVYKLFTRALARKLDL